MSKKFWLKKMFGKTQAKSTAHLPREQSSNPNNEPLEVAECIDISKRLEWFQQNLSNSSDVQYHKFVAGPEVRCSLIYLKGMIDHKTVEKSVLGVITTLDASMSIEQFISLIMDKKHLPISEQSIQYTLKEALRKLLNRDALLLIDGDPRILAISVVSFTKRAIEEPKNETVIRGPREAFLEDLETNLTLLRRRMKSPSFKVEMMHIGTETSTSVAITYLHGKCSQQLVEEMKRRLSSIDIDGILATSYIEECIEDNPYSPFPQLQLTERPDVVNAALLEGRIGVLVDGTPIALIAPTTIFMLMQAAEDYYHRYIAASWIRYIRYFFLFVSLLLPSAYIAITTFHPEILPERLLITLASSREVVPFNSFFEAFMMELSFEALREASVRIPKTIGQSVSIIGALIIGTAAVEAGIASAAMVIIVSLTGISSFIIPHFELGFSFRMLRFPIMILAGILGLYGIACAMILIYLHLLELRSFGVPYLAPVAPLVPNDLKDTLGRAPWWKLTTRTSLFGLSQGGIRQPTNSRKWAQSLEDNHLEEE
ncbi:spore germination protein [Paenibacillus sp. MAH-36]|uniref:Spore germination protein n=1 Tax=Paenibacillus violae TaxID=3077234 RepID=A0ABU3RKI5_9BACL|nr:spore germination protein [Paenibacillus sp. PFR10]MDU0204795.1 spore germination protein [Paenibacillus sp. PFR10]